MAVTERLGLEVYVQGMDQVIATLQKIDANTTKSGKSMENMGKSAKSGFAKVADGAADMKGMIDIVGSSIKQVQNFADSMYEMGKSAAQGVAIRDSFAYMAKGVGESSKTMLEALRTAAKGTISDTKLMLAANTAMTLGVSSNTSDLAGLLEVAQVRARRFSLSTEQAFSDLARGIGRLSPMILDNLGFTVDAENTYAAYAKTVGVAADKLTDMEKRQALVNRILQDTKAEVDAANSSTEAYINTFERWDATSENFKQAMGEAILPALSDGINSWMGLGDQIDRTNQLMAIHNSAQSQAGSQEEMLDMIRRMTAGLDETAIATKYGTAAMGDFNTELGHTNDISGGAKSGIDGIAGALGWAKDEAEAAALGMGRFARVTEETLVTSDPWTQASEHATSAFGNIEAAEKAYTDQSKGWANALIMLAKEKGNVELEATAENFLKGKSTYEELAIIAANSTDSRVASVLLYLGEAKKVYDELKTRYLDVLVGQEKANATAWSNMKTTAVRDTEVMVALISGHLRNIPREVVINVREVYYPSAAAQAARQAAGGGYQEYQHGGIVTRPTRALIGEAGPEAVLPLSDPGRMARVLAQAMSMRGVGSSYTHSPSYNLSTTTQTRAGGLRMEFGAMAAADEMASR